MSDLSKHLSYFKVENFKRFKSLELKDIGQFNIIVGDNNTGKTSLLEALLINYDSSNKAQLDPQDRLMRTFVYLGKRLKQRTNTTDSGNLSFSEQDIHKYFANNLVQNKEYILFSITTESESISISVSPTGSNNFSIYIDSIPFIGFGNFYENTFEAKYSRHIQKSVTQKNKYTNGLRAFIPNLSYLDMSLDRGEMKLLIAESHKDATTEIGKFGEGSLKLARILVDTMVYAGERLMIDEVEAGVHWSRFQVFWKTILLSAIENNTQLFMTTHDAECLQYLINAIDETPELASVKDKFRLIELRERTTDNDIAPIIHNYEALHYFLENGREVRGGHIVK